MLMKVPISLEMWMQCGPTHGKCGCNVDQAFRAAIYGPIFCLKNSKFFSGLKKLAHSDAHYYSQLLDIHKKYFDAVSHICKGMMR